MALNLLLEISTYHLHSHFIDQSKSGTLHCEIRKINFPTQREQEAARGETDRGGDLGDPP